MTVADIKGRAGACNDDMTMATGNSVLDRMFHSESGVLRIRFSHDEKSLKGLSKLLKSGVCREVRLEAPKNLSLVQYLLTEISKVPNVLERIHLDLWSSEALESLELFKNAFDAHQNKLVEVVLWCRFSCCFVSTLLRHLPKNIVYLDISENILSRGDFIDSLIEYIEASDVKILRMANTCIKKIDRDTFVRKLLDTNSPIALDAIQGLDLSECLEIPKPIRNTLKEHPSKSRRERLGYVDDAGFTCGDANVQLLDYIKSNLLMKRLIGTRVRVWWQATEDENRNFYSGRFWPARVLRVNATDLNFVVEYDNQEVDVVPCRFIQPLSPFKYGGGLDAEYIKYILGDDLWKRIKSAEGGGAVVSPGAAVEEGVDGFGVVKSSAGTFGVKGIALENIKSSQGSEESGGALDNLKVADDVPDGIANVPSSTFDSNVKEHRSPNYKRMLKPEEQKRVKSRILPAASLGVQGGGLDDLKVQNTAMVPSTVVTPPTTPCFHSSSASTGFTTNLQTVFTSPSPKFDSFDSASTLASTPCVSNEFTSNDFNLHPQTPKVITGSHSPFKSFDSNATSSQVISSNFTFQKNLETCCGFPVELSGAVLLPGELCEFRDVIDIDGNDPSDYVGLVHAVNDAEPLYICKCIYQDDETLAKVDSNDARRLVLIPWYRWCKLALGIERSIINGHAVDFEAILADEFKLVDILDDLVPDPPPNPLEMNLCSIQQLVDYSKPLLFQHPRVLALEGSNSNADNHLDADSSPCPVIEAAVSLREQQVQIAKLQQKLDAINKLYKGVLKELEEERSRNLELQSKLNCIVCFENRVDVLLGPCGHFSFCKSCSENFKTCPICRRKITRRQHVVVD